MEESVNNQNPHYCVQATSFPEAHLNRKEKRKLRSKLRSILHYGGKKYSGKYHAVDVPGNEIITGITIPAPPSTLDWVSNWAALRTPLRPGQVDDDTQSLYPHGDEHPVHPRRDLQRHSAM